MPGMGGAAWQGRLCDGEAEVAGVGGVGDSHGADTGGV